MPGASSNSTSDYQLSDRYADRGGTVFMTGIQALARLPIEQLRADRAHRAEHCGVRLRVSGVPLERTRPGIRASGTAAAPRSPFVVQPAVNEELGATAVMGSQLAPGQPDATLRRRASASGTARRRASIAPATPFATASTPGASRHGGAVVMVGDDPAARARRCRRRSDARPGRPAHAAPLPGDVPRHSNSAAMRSRCRGRPVCGRR